MTTMIVRAGIPCANCKGAHPSMAAFNRCKETTRERNRRMMDDFEAMFSDDDEEPDEEEAFRLEDRAEEYGGHVHGIEDLRYPVTVIVRRTVSSHHLVLVTGLRENGSRFSRQSRLREVQLVCYTCISRWLESPVDTPFQGGTKCPQS